MSFAVEDITVITHLEMSSARVEQKKISAAFQIHFNHSDVQKNINLEAYINLSSNKPESVFTVKINQRNSDTQR